MCGRTGPGLAPQAVMLRAFGPETSAIPLRENNEGPGRYKHVRDDHGKQAKTTATADSSLRFGMTKSQWLLEPDRS